MATSHTSLDQLNFPVGNFHAHPFAFLIRFSHTDEVGVFDGLGPNAVYHIYEILHALSTIRGDFFIVAGRSRYSYLMGDQVVYPGKAQPIQRPIRCATVPIPADVLR